MSIFDSIIGRDTAAEAGRTVGVEAGLALGAYDKNAKATIEGQNPSQQQAKTEGLVKDKVIPDLQIGDSKAMSGGAPSPEKNRRGDRQTLSIEQITRWPVQKRALGQHYRRCASG